MNNQDRGEFSSLLSSVMKYYRQDISPFVMQLFWDSLQRFDYNEIARAFSLHAQDPDRGQFAPKVADIVRFLEGSTTSQGMSAWAKVEKAMRMVGSYQSVVFDDPLIHATLSDMGGDWPALCQTLTSELPFKAREFERRYAALKTMRTVPAYPSRLVGISESQNRTNGFEPPAPILIGDKDKALKVLTSGAEGGTLRITNASDIASEALKRLGVES